MANGKHRAIGPKQKPPIVACTEAEAEQDRLLHETLAAVRARLLARARRAAARDDSPRSGTAAARRWERWLGGWGSGKGRWHDC